MNDIVNDLFDDNLGRVSLVDLLNENDDINDVPDDAPVFLSNSKYYNNDDFSTLLNEKKGNFIVLSLNSQSLNAKFNELQIYLEKYSSEHALISAICLQETWLSSESDTSLLQLENYQLISRGKSCSAHGGVAIYLHNMFSYNGITKFQILRHI